MKVNIEQSLGNGGLDKSKHQFRLRGKRDGARFHENIFIANRCAVFSARPGRVKSELQMERFRLRLCDAARFIARAKSLPFSGGGDFLGLSSIAFITGQTWLKSCALC